jgi:hypothetical protein
LNNLVGRTLERAAPDRAGIARLLAAAERNLGDARLAALSAENRFDAAYKAVMLCATVGLRAIGLAKDRMILLDALRKQRNLADYEGEAVTPKAVAECLSQAEQLLADTKVWLQAHKPELVSQAAEPEKG